MYCVRTVWLWVRGWLSDSVCGFCRVPRFRCGCLASVYIQCADKRASFHYSIPSSENSAYIIHCILGERVHQPSYYSSSYIYKYIYTIKLLGHTSLEAPSCVIAVIKSYFLGANIMHRFVGKRATSSFGFDIQCKHKQNIHTKKVRCIMAFTLAAQTCVHRRS